MNRRTRRFSHNSSSTAVIEQPVRCLAHHFRDGVIHPRWYDLRRDMVLNSRPERTVVWLFVSDTFYCALF